MKHDAPPNAILPEVTATLVAALLAVDAQGLGGVILDHPVHEQSRAFCTLLRSLLPDRAPLRRLPIGVSADRLIGGVDLAATLQTGRLISERGVLASADGGVVVVPMAERVSVAVRTTLAEVLDTATLVVARDGVQERHQARIAVVLLDESVDEEAVHPSLVDRVAFRLTESTIREDEIAPTPSALHDARERLSQVQLDERWVAALCETAEAFGVISLRVPLFALRCARALAALDERTSVTEADVSQAARLVLAPRATRVPVAPPENEDAVSGDDRSSAEHTPPRAEEQTPPDQRDEPALDTPAHSDSASDAEAESAQSLSAETDVLREAVTAAIPPGLLAQLLARANSGAMQGRAGSETPSMLRGRPRGARAGMPRGGARLHLLETLRAAAPWQRVRAQSTSDALRPRVAIRLEDFRIRRFVERTGTTVIFVVDASGSAAMQRLSEAKGAIEVLLAESYARRDRVCLLAFRGKGVELLLAPTRALARARKVLAAMPGGGGTPIATAIDRAAEQALATRRDGSAPLVVFLSDGRANIARDGTPGRPAAERDALTAAAVFAQGGYSALFVDTSPRGDVAARRIASAMRARYVFLPFADSRALGGLVRSAMQSSATTPARASTIGESATGESATRV